METYHEADPDFFIHVAEKKYVDRETLEVSEVNGK
tara:strand:+ start:69 stop:173 length:105 start_codon:yes stop_codon:yes gene_type:complete